MVTADLCCRSDPGGLGLQQLLIMIASGEKGLQVGSAIGLQAGRSVDGVLKGGELAIADQVKNVEVDLSENAPDLIDCEFGTGNGGEVGEIHRGRQLRK